MPISHPTFQIRVYYEDTDTGGIVYYANYLKYVERARSEVLRQLGINQTDLMATHQIGFAVRSCQIEFLKPARLDDLLTIETKLEEIGHASLAMQQTVYCAKEKLVTLAVKLAVVGAGMKPAKLPEPVRQALAGLFETA